jgi:hypothetical protein
LPSAATVIAYGKTEQQRHDEERDRRQVLADDDLHIRSPHRRQRLEGTGTRFLPPIAPS